MNALRLLAHYDRVADAADAVPRLRRFILDLAVRGKLVPGDPKDETASELLKRIGAQKARLVKAGEIKKSEPVTDLTSSRPEIPVPVGWAITNLQSICNSITDGDHLPPPKAESGIPFLVIGNVRSQRIKFAESRFVPSEYYEALNPIRRPRIGDLLYTLVGSFGIPVIVRDDQPFCVQRHIGIMRPSKFISVSFLSRVMESRFIFDQASACATGIAQKTVPLSGLRNISILLPPLAEQHRIVAKVDELMALCDRLEAARAEREVKRDRLAAASLARLNRPDPDTFQADARFALNALPALTTRADQIKQFRQTILNLAVRGKLVPQNRKEEPAPKLDRAMPADIELPFDIPATWNWARLHALGKLKGGGTPSKARDDYWSGEIPWVSPKDMKVDYVYESQMCISEAALADSAANLIEPGSVLFVVRGMILAHSFPVAVTRVPLAINQDMKAIVLSKPEMAEFVLRALNGLKPEMLKLVKRSSHGTCRLEGSGYSNFVIPVPPLAEQRRIVAKVDELMTLCDRLEVSLAAGDDPRRRLLDALLAEALLPANGVIPQEPQRAAAHG
jgi:type I restriction enzyme S subunit